MNTSKEKNGGNRFNLTPAQLKQCRKIMEEAIIVDCLTFIPLLNNPRYLETLRTAGVTATHVTIPDPADNCRDALKKLALWREAIDSNQNETVLAFRASDIKMAKETGKVAIIMGSQNGKIIEDELTFVRVFKELGIRIIQLAYQDQNYIASGCGESKPGGLSSFGHKVICEMEKLGILVDLSHCAPLTTDEVLEISTRPLIISHSGPSKRCEHIRNKSDNQIKKLASKGGVMGIPSWSAFTPSNYGPRPAIEDYLDNIEYVISLVGDDHVGIGLDFDPLWTKLDYDTWRAKYPECCGRFEFENMNLEGLHNVSCISRIVEGLIARKHGEDTIKKILGGNFMRVFGEVWE